MQTEIVEALTCVDLTEGYLEEVINTSCNEAQRLMSPNAFNNYLTGIRAMCTLGRGEDLVLTYVQEMPMVVREVGEDSITDVIEAMMKLSSLTSGAVITLVLSGLPLAAERLGDVELLRGYLGLIHQLAGKAPRGLRPMLENQQELLSRLTLGGLRRWALWGAQAYQRDFEGQTTYFSLQSETSRSILKRERRGVLFVDQQRKLNSYLRALWARPFFMRPTSGDYESREGLKPFVEGWQIFLPDAFDALEGIKGSDMYRAAAAHAAAHLTLTTEPVYLKEFTPAQICFIELAEDARVELVTSSRFPGLRRLWADFFRITLEQNNQCQPMLVLMMQLNLSILDEDYDCGRGPIKQLAAEFRKQIEQKNPNADDIITIGLAWFDELKQLADMPAERELRALPISYRDDNRYFRDFSLEQDVAAEVLPWLKPTVRRRVSVMEMVNEIDSELVDDSPQEVWILPTELFPYEDEGVSYNESEGVEPVSDPFHYDEWDYHLQLARPDWVTVVERRQKKGDPAIMDNILEKHKPVANRIRHLVDILQPQGVVRQRGFEDGDELDINAAVNAMVDIRRGIMPDTRFHIRIKRHFRDLSIILLMDLSESTNDRIGVLKEGDEGYEEQPRILDVTREASGLLTWAVDSIGDNFAVHGFASEGRHDVQYYCFKDFDEGYSDQVRARMAGMTGGLSTRMGAALRHAGSHLRRQPTSKRLVLLVTDGEPADIDERDPQYLRMDTKHAVEELATDGIATYCLTLDPDADSYVSRIFGRNNYSIVDNVELLPERLPRVFSALTS